jgi:hypothetical protein
MKAVYLVSCVSKKQAKRARAKDLYVSTWFQKARAYVESDRGARWFILSAKHGLLDPKDVTFPYEKTLYGMQAASRRKWAAKVIRQMNHLSLSNHRVVVLAGVRYREFLIDYLKVRSAVVDIPLKRLSIGRQLQWLTKHKPHVST